jgi:alpha(1,3/1,4) fucosyltransferase
MTRIKGRVEVSSYYYKNLIFDDKKNKEWDYTISRYIRIFDLFKKNNIDLFTNDLLNDSDANFNIQIDFQSLPNPTEKNYLIVNEPSIIIPSNHNLEILKKFDKVFTYNDDLKGENIIKVNLPYDFKNIKTYKNFSKKGYLLVVSNLKSNKIHENYSLRNEVIDFFEDKDLGFHLYGKDWNKKTSSSRFVNKLLKYFPVSNKIKSYKGVIDDKIKLGSNYLFQFAIENSSNINGYISEKLFHCFFSGCIPIYLGPKNILDYIPKKSFINISDFKSLEDLINYCENLTLKEINQIRESGSIFLKSSDIERFDYTNYSDVIVENILNDLSK